MWTPIPIEKKYYVFFDDGEGNQNQIEITEEQFDLFDSFELEDISCLHKEAKYRYLIGRDDLTQVIITKHIVNQKGKSPTDNSFENLYEAIEKLSPTQKRRIKMYYFDGYNYREISEMEGCTIRSVELSIKFALKKLKSFLE